MSNTVRSMKIRFFGVMAALFISAIIVQVSAASSGKPLATNGCIRPQKHLIADGRSPSERHWTVTAAIRNNGSCRAWLFSIDIRPSGTLRGSSRWAWMIPAGGHLSTTFTMDAQDEGAGSDRAFYGVVGSRVKTIELTMSRGRRIVVHPKLPPLDLRERFVWLRSMRYAIRYYTAEKHVRAVRLFNARSELIEMVRGWDGEFSSPG